MIKNQDEISCLKTCAAMVDGVWFRVWETLKPGMKDTDLMTLGSAAGYELGLESAVPGGWRTGPMTFERLPRHQPHHSGWRSSLWIVLRRHLHGIWQLHLPDIYRGSRANGQRKRLVQTGARTYRCRH